MPGYKEITLFCGHCAESDPSFDCPVCGGDNELHAQTVDFTKKELEQGNLKGRISVNCCFCNGGSKPHGESEHICPKCDGKGTIPADVPEEELLASYRHLYVPMCRP